MIKKLPFIFYDSVEHIFGTRKYITNFYNKITHTKKDNFFLLIDKDQKLNLVFYNLKNILISLS